MASARSRQPHLALYGGRYGLDLMSKKTEEEGREKHEDSGLAARPRILETPKTCCVGSNQGMLPSMGLFRIRMAFQIAGA